MRAKVIVLVVAAMLLVGVWTACGPLPAQTREELFEIPKGTWARRMAGEPLAILPDEIRLTLRIRDVLLLRNLDDVPQLFGPTLLMPGQRFRLPFDMAADYQFVCTAHASGQMTIIVEEFPSSPWARMEWRFRRSGDVLRKLSVRSLWIFGAAR